MTYLCHFLCSVCNETFTKTGDTMTEVVNDVKKTGCPNDGCKNVVGVITLVHSELVANEAVDALNSEFSKVVYF